MSNADYDRLSRALQRASPTHPEARREVSLKTKRDFDPALGSLSLLLAADSGRVGRLITTLNIIRANGTQGRAFYWALSGFGWAEGEWS